MFRSRKNVVALRSFTLESGRAEIDHVHQRRKEEAITAASGVSPIRGPNDGSTDSARSPQSARSPGLRDVPEEGSPFAIGDDEDSDTENQTTAPPTPSYSSASREISRNPSISSIDESLPAQVRGMSEKARGKMPVGQPSFARQDSTTSISSHTAAATAVNIASPSSGFEPTSTWIDSWLPNLPLHTILTLLSSDTPPTHLPSTIDPTPPRVHLFEWTKLSLGWYESLLWGFIFTSEMLVGKGTVGVWNNTAVRLFRVEKENTSGPSLMKPMGAVDAVGTRLVSGVKSLGSGTAARVASNEGRLPMRERTRDV